MSRAPIMQTEPRWRIECWHQPCSTCCLASINIWVTGEAVTYLLPSNGIGSVPFALVHFGPQRPNAGDVACSGRGLPLVARKPLSHGLIAVAMQRFPPSRRVPPVAVHG